MNAFAIIMPISAIFFGFMIEGIHYSKVKSIGFEPWINQCHSLIVEYGKTYLAGTLLVWITALIIKNKNGFSFSAKILTSLIIVTPFVSFLLLAKPIYGLYLWGVNYWVFWLVFILIIKLSLANGKYLLSYPERVWFSLKRKTKNIMSKANMPKIQ